MLISGWAGTGVRVGGELSMAGTDLGPELCRLHFLPSWALVSPSAKQ